MSTPLSKRSNSTIQDSEESLSEPKRSKLSVAEGISQLVDEMKESRKLKMDIASKPDRAIKLFISEYTKLDIDDYSKVLEYLSEPKNATIFLALEGVKPKQKEWLQASLNIWLE
jgi:hypothetical protein